jgi:hypothetical protein
LDQLKWVDTPVSSATSQNTNRPAATTTGSKPNDTQAKKADRNYPDHAVLNATKDQLKSLPQFDYKQVNASPPLKRPSPALGLFFVGHLRK